MNAKVILPLLALIFLCFGSIKGQMDCQNNALIHKIDSISKAKNIENGMIKFHRVTSIGETTSTEH